MAFQGAIFDVDGVLVDSPHELAWRESFKRLMETDWADIAAQTSYTPEKFSPALYQQIMAGKPRMAGATAALEHFGVPDAERRAKEYADAKQEQVVALIEAGQFTAFPDALRFILAVKNLGIPVGCASSSKNAGLFLRQIRLDTFAAEQRIEYGFIKPGLVLLDLFDANVAGRDFAQGKPHPEIFLTAARELGVNPALCFVVEDASSGIQAAKAGKMSGLGVARLDDAALLAEAGADLVVTSLDDVSLDGLGEGRLRERRSIAGDKRRKTERPRSVWSLEYDRFDASRQGLREALTTLGNGFFATRGALAETSADDANYPGTYVAGLYNRATTEIAGRDVENEDLVNVPNWLPLAFRVEGGAWFDVTNADVLDHRVELDLRAAVLTRNLHWQDAEGRRTSMVQRRFTSMKDMHHAAIECTFVAENWSGTLEVRSGIDGSVINSGVKRYRDLNGKHLDIVSAAQTSRETIVLVAETNQSHVRLGIATRVRVTNGADASARRDLENVGEKISQTLAIRLERGASVTLEKVAALYTSRDRAISDVGEEAADAAERAPAFAELLARHTGAWASLWERFDIELDSGNQWTEMVLHLHEFHLLQTVSPNTIGLDVGVPARGWHGEAYRGHIFWDEMFIFPFLNFQRPVLAETLLRYRHSRLGTARAAAKAEGFAGAMFPWQSGSNGREETQQVHLNPKSGRWLPDHSHLQRHVNIAIAYNVWQHYMVTGSMQFLRFLGAELLIEIARFWASATTFDEQLGRYEIRGVMGPDEYHEAYPGSDRPGLANNTYTNVMAVWVMQRALEALEVLPPHYRQELVESLHVEDAELARWRDIGIKMRVVFHTDGVLSQFDGYEALPEFDWEGYRAKYGNVQRLDRVLEAEGDSPNNYKLSKQADVLMLLFVLSRDELRGLMRGLGYEVTDDQLARTVAYYLARTSNGSTLSAIVSTWVLARTDPKAAWKFLNTALESDIADVQGGTTAEGIHLGAMAGTVDLVQRRLTGMRAQGRTLRFDPALPPEVKHLRFSVHYRGHRIELVLTEDNMKLTSRPSTAPSISIAVRERTVELAPGETVEFALASV